MTAHACGKDNDDNKQSNQHAASIWARKAAGIWVHTNASADPTRILGLIGLGCLCKTDHKSALFFPRRQRVSANLKLVICTPVTLLASKSYLAGVGAAVDRRSRLPTKVPFGRADI